MKMYALVFVCVCEKHRKWSTGHTICKRICYNNCLTSMASSFNLHHTHVHDDFAMQTFAQRITFTRRNASTFYKQKSKMWHPNVRTSEQPTSVVCHLISSTLTISNRKWFNCCIYCVLSVKKQMQLNCSWFSFCYVSDYRSKYLVFSFFLRRFNLYKTYLRFFDVIFVIEFNKKPKQKTKIKNKSTNRLKWFEVIYLIVVLVRSLRVSDVDQKIWDVQQVNRCRNINFHAIWNFNWIWIFSEFSIGCGTEITDWHWNRCLYWLGKSGKWWSA